MKNTMVRTMLLVISVSALCISMTSGARADDGGQCTTAGAAGKWGFTLTGTILLPAGPVPAAAAGHFNADKMGNIVGTEQRSVGGGFASETIRGRWAISRDCTTRFAANIYDQTGALVRTSVLDAVFVNDGNKIRSVQESLTLPDGSSLPVVITIEGDRVFKGGELVKQVN